MVSPKRKPRVEEPGEYEEQRPTSARHRSEKRWGTGIWSWLAELRRRLGRLGLLGRVHTGVAERLFGDEFYQGKTEKQKQEMDDLGRFIFIGIPDGRGGYISKTWIHEDAVPGHLSDGWSIVPEEDDMPLTDQDKLEIGNILDARLNSHKFKFNNLSYDNKNLAAIISAAIVISGAVLFAANHVSNSLGSMQTQIEVLSTKIDERLPPKPAADTKVMGERPVGTR